MAGARRLAKPCNHPGCGQVVAAGVSHCAAHAPAAKSRAMKRRELRRKPSPGRRWYKWAAWQALRRQQLEGAPLCKACEGRGVITAATDVDHIVPWTDRATFFDPTNLQSLCRSCHSGKTMRESVARLPARAAEPGPWGGAGQKSGGMP